MKELSEKQLLEEIKEKFEYRDGNLYWREGNGKKSGKLIGGGTGLYKVCAVNRVQGLRRKQSSLLSAQTYFFISPRVHA